MSCGRERTRGMSSWRLSSPRGTWQTSTCQRCLSAVGARPIVCCEQASLALIVRPRNEHWPTALMRRHSKCSGSTNSASGSESERRLLRSRRAGRCDPGRPVAPGSSDRPTPDAARGPRGRTAPARPPCSTACASAAATVRTALPAPAPAGAICHPSTAQFRTADTTPTGSPLPAVPRSNIHASETAHQSLSRSSSRPSQEKPPA